VTPLEQWLAEATRDLSPESAARVRAEIQEHSDSARESGEDAIAALGDPRTANREYRKALLTETEAMMAPVLTQKRAPSNQSRLFGLLILAAIYRTSWGKDQGPGFWPVQIVIFSALPLTWLLPQTAQQETRLFIYLHGARNLVVVAVVWWYQGWAIALMLGAMCFALDYFASYKRMLVFRKLDAGQTFRALPGEPAITHLEAIYLKGLRHPTKLEQLMVAVIFLMIGASAPRHIRSDGCIYERWIRSAEGVAHLHGGAEPLVPHRQVGRHGRCCCGSGDAGCTSALGRCGYHGPVFRGLRSAAHRVAPQAAHRRVAQAALFLIASPFDLQNG
jgi:hypothetical protein